MRIPKIIDRIEQLDSVQLLQNKTLYVDKKRTDTYTENGTVTKPFKTIMGAINQIITNADNSQAIPYTIRIATGVYAENIILEDSHIVSLVMIGEGSRLQTQINPSSGYSLRSIANNSNFYDLHVENIQFIKDTMLVGATNGNYFGLNFFFVNCYWPSTALATFKNMVYPGIFGNVCKFSGGIVISNVTQMSIDNIGGFKTGSFTYETDENANKPNSFSGGSKLSLTNCTIPNITWSLLNIVTLTGTIIQIRGCRYGSAGETIPLNAAILSYNSTLVGAYVNNGTLTLYNSQVSGALSGTSPVLYQFDKQIVNSSAATGNTVKDALDSIDGRVDTLESAPGGITPPDALTIGQTINLGIKYSGGTLSICQADGTDLANTDGNRGYICLPSVTPGKNVVLAVTANHTINDDAHASSNLSNLTFGITATAHYAYDMFFKIYGVNEDDTSTNLGFCITRRPEMSTTPIASYIHDKDAAAANDNISSIMGMWNDDAGKASKPCVKIGAIRMQWSTTTDDWTIQTLGNTDGIGEDKLRATHAKRWGIALGHFGATAGKLFVDGAGTAPVFTLCDQDYLWFTESDTGEVGLYMNLYGDGGTDGSGAVSLEFRTPIPMQNAGHMGAIVEITDPGSGLSYHFGVAYSYAVAQSRMWFRELISGATYAENGDFSSGGRTIGTFVVYKGCYEV